MSGVYTYCVVSAGFRPPAGLTGLGGKPVEWCDVGPFTVWTSNEDVAPRLDLDQVSRHHEVVRAAAAETTPLPVRFGAWAPDHSALSARIQRARPELEAALSATSGRIELGVRVEEVPDPPSKRPSQDEPTDGRAYMRALSRGHADRHARRQRQNTVLERLERCLASLPRETNVRYLEPPGLVSVAHLITRENEERYRRLVRELSETAASGERIYVTGPWPPYSFASV